MSPFDIGYKKPPLSTRFRKGVCPNLRGRGASKKPDARSVIDDLLSEKVAYLERGRRRRASRLQLVTRRLVENALKGDVASVDALLKLHSEMKERGDIGPIVIRILNDLPEPNEALVPLYPEEH